MLNSMVMDRSNIESPPLPAPVAAVVQTQAEAFYNGAVSSVDAFTVIDRVANSAWHWFPGILNITREDFDRHIGRLIDAEVDGWTAQDDTTPTTRF